MQGGRKRAVFLPGRDSHAALGLGLCLGRVQSRFSAVRSPETTGFAFVVVKFRLEMMSVWMSTSRSPQTLGQEWAPLASHAVLGVFSWDLPAQIQRASLGFVLCLCCEELFVGTEQICAFARCDLLLEAGACEFDALQISRLGNTQADRLR